MLAGKYYFVCCNHSNWLLDSGATDHICCNLEYFDACEELKGCNNYITIPDGRKVQVTHKATVVLNDCLSLDNVLFVPEFQYNLISINKLRRDLHCSIMFTKIQCYRQQGRTQHRTWGDRCTPTLKKV
ncbi:Retrovirus-related Pol polyprotein from transposon RE2 [Bienertia sinuspersici]